MATAKPPHVNVGTALQQEFAMLESQVYELVNEAFMAHRDQAHTTGRVASAAYYDMFAAKCAQLSEALKILGDRAEGVASELLED